MLLRGCPKATPPRRSADSVSGDQEIGYHDHSGVSADVSPGVSGGVSHGVSSAGMSAGVSNGMSAGISVMKPEPVPVEAGAKVTGTLTPSDLPFTSYRSYVVDAPAGARLTGMQPHFPNGSTTATQTTEPGFAPVRTRTLSPVRPVPVMGATGLTLLAFLAGAMIAHGAAARWSCGGGRRSDVRSKGVGGA